MLTILIGLRYHPIDRREVVANRTADNAISPAHRIDTGDLPTSEALEKPGRVRIVTLLSDGKVAYPMIWENCTEPAACS